MEPRIKLLISYYKPAQVIKSDILTPIHSGRKLSTQTNKDGTNLSKNELQFLHDNMIGDDTGDNISEKNYLYNELSIQYWAYRNLSQLNNPVYVGFMHHRRHFMFQMPEPAPDKVNELFHFNKLDKNYIESIGLTDENIISQVKGNDILAFSPIIFDDDISVREQFKQYATSTLYGDKEIYWPLVEKTETIVKTKYPEFSKAFDQYFSGNKHYFCNMFIMRRDLFLEYSEWLFSILFSLEKEPEIKNLSILQSRTFGHIGERLLGVFLNYINNKNTYKLEHLSVSLVENTTPKEVNKLKKQKHAKAICLASSEEYAKYLEVCIRSLLQNTTASSQFDIIILTTDMTEYTRCRLKSSLKPYQANISIIDISDHVKPLMGLHKDILSGMAGHISIDTLSRLTINKVLSHYKDVIYLDTDAIVLGDINSLFQEPFKNNELAMAVPDIEYQRIANTNQKVKEYCNKTLKLINHNDYFQGGLIRFNIEKINEENPDIFLKAITKLATKEILFADQCILNYTLNGRVRFLPIKWNVEWHIPLIDKQFINQLPANTLHTYMKARNKPSMIHYCSYLKPWINPEHELAEYFWHYAKDSTFYPEIIQEIKPKTQLSSNMSIKKVLANRILTTLFPKGHHKKTRLAKKAAITLLGQDSPLVNRLKSIYSYR